MKKWFVFFCAASTALGCIWHFLYDWVPVPLIGLFAPVDESVWEHLKLLLWPVVPAAAVLAWRSQRPKAVLSGFLTAILLMPVVLLSVYYVAGGAFLIGGLFFDIGLYVVTMVFGFALAWRLTCSGRAVPHLGTLIMLCGLWAAALLCFSIAAPALPIFDSYA